MRPKRGVPTPSDTEVILQPLRLVYRRGWDDSLNLPVPPPPPTTDVSTEASSSGPIRLEHPLNIVIFTYTNTDPCQNFEECKLSLRYLLKESRNKNLYDIPYSFLVGGDGTVYEGRGLLRAPEPNRRYESAHGVSLVIAHIGYDGRTPPLAMASGAWDLVQYLVKTSVFGYGPVFYTDYN